MPKQIPEHHGQVDVKFLTLQGPAGQRIRRYQYTAIDDATRIRARTQSRTPSPSQATWPGRFPSAFTRCAPTAAMSSRRCFHWHLADPRHPACLHQAPHPTTDREGRALPSHGSAGVLSAPELQGRCRSGATAGRVGALLQLRSAPRSIRRPDPLRSTPRTVTVIMATVPRDPSHHNRT